MPPLVDAPKIFFISEMDSKENSIDFVLHEKVPAPGIAYSPPSQAVGAVSTGSNNLPSTSSTPPATGGSNYRTVSGSSSSVQKTLMQIGKKLKTTSAIAKWLCNQGTGGFVYLSYELWGHRPWNGYRCLLYSNNKQICEDRFDNFVFSTRWNKRSMNCHTFSWAFVIMCKGAGIKMGIKYGQANPGTGWTAHAWNVDKAGRYWELTNSRPGPNTMPRSFYRPQKEAVKLIF